MAMAPDRYPRLFELGPGIAAGRGYSGRGICTATILGAELARWAAGDAGIDELAMPASSFRTLPYYALRGIIVDSAVRYYSMRDRVPDAGQASA
jgi:glycine/D-amino acid oxidase-like deaminating enzyme